jgi:hypothetical protein
MNQNTSGFRDIFLIFILCVLIIFSVSVNKSKSKNESHFLAFHEVFQPSTSTLTLIPTSTSPSKSTSTSTPEKQRSSKSNKKEIYIIRVFKWKDLTQKERETVFQISESALKDEIKKFGRPRALMHPLMMEKKGFKIIGRQDIIVNRKILERVLTIVDYKQIFQRNLKYFSSLTHILMESADAAAGQDPLYVFLSFVQYIRYQQPPEFYKGKFIGSFFVPLVCLNEQYGDCDSKSILLAEFLATAPNSKEKMAMVLVRGGGLAHAILGIKRKPLPGMTTLYFQEKGYFIVLETTRPGWAPGFIDHRVTDALKAGYFMFVDLN